MQKNALFISAGNYSSIWGMMLFKNLLSFCHTVPFFFPVFSSKCVYCFYHRDFCFLSGKHSVIKIINFPPSLFLFLKAIPFDSDTMTFCFTNWGNSKYWLLLKSRFLFVFYNLLNRLIDLWLTGTVTLQSSWENLKSDFWFLVKTANTMSRKCPKIKYLQKIIQNFLYNLGTDR